MDTDFIEKNFSLQSNPQYLSVFMCKECGALIPGHYMETDSIELHYIWHRSLEGK